MHGTPRRLLYLNRGARLLILAALAVWSRLAVLPVSANAERPLSTSARRAGCLRGRCGRRPAHRDARRPLAGAGRDSALADVVQRRSLERRAQGG